jgi:hypothetical protein
MSLILLLAWFDIILGIITWSWGLNLCVLVSSILGLYVRRQ